MAWRSVKYKDGKYKTDNSGGGGSGEYLPLIYSEEEREVGVWADGKPLYQKSFKFINDVNFTNGKTFDTNISNMDFGFVSEATFYDYSQNRNESLPFWQTINTDSSPSSYMQVGVQTDTKKMVLRTNATWTANANRFLTVTLLYTKTTDTPGSGTWAPSGGYAHHYSTTEQVIGTWIDGKPIYEKTVYIETANETLHGITNIDQVVSVSGITTARTDSSGEFRPTPFCYSGLSSAWISGLTIKATKINLEAGSSFTSAHPNAYIIIRYTKTTD